MGLLPLLALCKVGCYGRSGNFSSGLEAIPGQASRVLASRESGVSLVACVSLRRGEGIVGGGGPAGKIPTSRFL